VTTEINGLHVLASDLPTPGRAHAETPALLDDELIPVDLGGITRLIRLTEVRHAQAQGDYVRLHTPTGSGLIRSPLATLEQRWGPAGFIRIHRSHLISLSHIEELRTDGGQLTVRINGDTLPVSRRRSSQLRNLLVRRSRTSATYNEEQPVCANSVGSKINSPG
jgi:two-component system response regulator LytT